ncbi:MAG: hypothetical protein M1834_008089 [Cirrosporium novae-zelandiae]|nr:MAG: hypothetical protein M1834_008089 [Cirrosporium novae-zelandiae]
MYVSREIAFNPAFSYQQFALILLVPTTEVLLTSRDRESGAFYTDLVASEEFLASHVLRIQHGAGADTKEPTNVRETKGKAKQFSTVNGRTVVIKDSAVYSNKGFKTLNQAQLLNDAIYYADTLETQQWLIYYISRPLLGSWEAILIIPASISDASAARVAAAQSKNLKHASPIPVKKDIKSFNELLNTFPMIARQMQPGLERLFKEFGKELGKPLPAPPSRSSSVSSRRSTRPSTSGSETNGSINSEYTNGHVKTPSQRSLYIDDDDENLMRRALETAVTAAIDLFQLVDKQQLSLLGATTDLTGPLVERLIERYVVEQVHDQLLFPRICSYSKLDDTILESRIRQVEHVDISQVGIPIGGGQHGKTELLRRLTKGVAEFRKMGVAGSPQQMLEVLLSTMKIITSSEPTKDSQQNGNSEKNVLTINADALVSMLLIVVIRSHVHHLYARLSYMQHFIYIDDVESGELGYALSTFEAVLAYLTRDSGGLRKASVRNKRLWQATKKGHVAELKNILEPDSEIDSEHEQELAITSETEELGSEQITNGWLEEYTQTWHSENANGLSKSPRFSDEIAEDPISDMSEANGLAHVFPWQAWSTESDSTEDLTPRKGKKVSMDLRSMSGSSGRSYISHATLDSRTSGLVGDTSLEKLSRTQNATGDSVPMMAIEARQPQSLKYLLSLGQFYPMESILEDTNTEGTTLLSAAIQLAHTEIVDMILDFVFHVPESTIIKYLAMQDTRGRSAAHYLFNAPHLISKIGTLLPWTQKDRNGQTPLFALCRSYDHPDYTNMVDEALTVVAKCQVDGAPLHLGDHVDGKGNTLLHIVSDSHLTRRILETCDVDTNATNDKRFTPLMVASKYGRVDVLRTFFGDLRTDLSLKELRGLTAVELAKDDEVRNRIDDLILFQNEPGPDGRITAVVRSFFVEDASIRLIVKSGAPNMTKETYTITTCRRSVADFETLTRWLAIEHPASWLPSIFTFRSPFQIPSKPSRAVLHDIQVRLDNFLKIMLAHSNFSTHELLWEFLLVPDIQLDMMGDRSSKKAEARIEKVREEYEPLEDVRDVESFVNFAREAIRGINHSTKSVARRVNNIRNISFDLFEAQKLSSQALSTISFLPDSHKAAFSRYSALCVLTDAHPYNIFFSDVVSISSTVLAILSSLARPHALIDNMSTVSKSIDRSKSSLRRADRWPLGLLDDTRNKLHKEAEEKVEKGKDELRTLGQELRYTQQTVASELAGWQVLHEKMGKRAIRKLAEQMVVREKEKLACLRRAVREVVDVDEKRGPERGRKLRR